MAVYNMLRELFISLRPKQWYKNLIIFVAIVFSFNFFNLQLLIKVGLAFIIFCMSSGITYLINDIMDKESDRLHPKKRNRPIASGKLNVRYALTAVLFLFILSLVLSYLINILFLSIVFVFIFLNLSYTFYFKHLVLVDVLTLSSGFVLRAMAGAIAIRVDISPWLIICVYLLAIFLSLCKRRQELVLLKDQSKNHRVSFEHYTKYMLDQLIVIVTSSLITSFLFYTFMAANRWIMITIPVVIYALFRYIFLAHNKSFGEEPEMIFRDKGMLISILIWVILTFIILYKIPEVLTNYIKIAFPAIFK